MENNKVETDEANKRNTSNMERHKKFGVDGRENKKT